MLWVFQLVQIVYWLALSTWFGGVLLVAFAPPLILRAVREQNPLLPSVLSVNLEGQHGTLLGGTVIGTLVAALLRVELVCAAVLLVTIAVQWFVADTTGTGDLVLAILRTTLFVAAAGLLVFDWRVLWPRIWRYRQEYVDNADNPEVANPALDQFDRHQAESFTVLRLMVLVLLGMIVFSANIRPPTQSLLPGVE